MDDPTPGDAARMQVVLERLDDGTFVPSDAEELRRLLRPYYETARYMQMGQLVRATQVLLDRHDAASGEAAAA